MKLFSIIKTFDKKQWKGFLIYIQLYHKHDTAICKIASWLDSKNIWRIEDDHEYTAEYVAMQLPFKIKPKTMTNLLGVLGNLAEEYLGWMVWRDTKNQKTSCQLLGLAQKSLTDQYLKTQSTVLKESDDKVVSIWDEHYKMHSLFNDYYLAISGTENNQKEIFNELIESYRKSTSIIGQLLRVEIKNRERILSESWSQHNGFFMELQNTETKLKNITEKLILINHNGEIDAYEFLMKILYSEEKDKFSRHVRYSIVSYCINFLSRIIKQGAIYRAQELLDLYEYSIEKEIYTLNDTMPLPKFINIIGVASKLQKYEWSRMLVNNWSHKVDEYNSKTIAKFGHATIDFHQKKYGKVVEALSQMKSSNFIHKLRSRWLLLMAQYEINKSYIDVVKVQVDNFRRFVISNESRINKSTYEGLKSSLQILKMLLARKNSSLIEEYYLTSKYVFERKWIMEKIKNPM